MGRRVCFDGQKTSSQVKQQSTKIIV